ncbi:MAG: hypothetical protein RML14_10915 [Meiothermus sp.]|uniref:hypothetical protein n=1 Tax=Meiothermus sp. TaxID=1955249 RepID=UPI00298EF3DD|nr:hypothetical protein [Meiothermus sp.]MDW8482353.1 hypothetical protein [Meiothermus sp.]
MDKAEAERRRQVLEGEDPLPEGPRRLLDLLILLGLETTRARFGQVHPGLTSATFHLPVELLAWYLGVHTTTIWRWRKALEERDLVRGLGPPRPHGGGGLGHGGPLDGAPQALGREAPV